MKDVGLSSGDIGLHDERGRALLLMKDVGLLLGNQSITVQRALELVRHSPAGPIISLAHCVIPWKHFGLCFSALGGL